MSTALLNRPANRTDQSNEQLAAQVEHVLNELNAQFQRLAQLSRQREDAVRRADTASLARTIAMENEAVQEVAEIEKRRIGIVGTLADRLGSTEKSQTRLTWIARALGGSIGERIEKRAKDLQETLTNLHKANEAARHAAQHLASHMEGLWRQAASVLNHAKTYGRAGSVSPGPQIISALDLKS